MGHYRRWELESKSVESVMSESAKSGQIISVVAVGVTVVIVVKASEVRIDGTRAV